VKAAVVKSFGQPPVFAEFSDPETGAGEMIVTGIAAALSHLVRGQASGRHYSSDSKTPFVPGVDGVGRHPDGKRVYFAFPRSPFGAMAEKVPVKSSLVVEIPDELDDVTAAAIANPGMSSWAALTRRAKFVAGETVFINGATGVSGRLAIQIAKYLGAGKIIATGRNLEALARLTSFGADVVLPLAEGYEDFKTAFATELAQGIDVILDYLWGPSAESMIQCIAGHGSTQAEPRIRFVQVGAMAGGTVSLPASALRSSGLELLGSGLGSVSYDELVRVIGEMLQAVRPGNFQIETEAVPLSEVDEAWNRPTGDARLVFTMN
jgi:NADPH:quinone reductase-like Zn-dependent oxidoreductase